MTPRLLIPVFCCLYLISVSFVARPSLAMEPPQPIEPSLEQQKFFEQRIRPLLAKRCFPCHGPDKQKGSLRLDSRASLLAGGDSGAAIEPGDAASSLLVEAIRHESFEMPPEEQLSDAEIADVTRWIELGAPWPGSDQARNVAKISDEDRSYWFFQPLRSATPPEVPQPMRGSIGNDIDRFVQARLAAAELELSPPADPGKLLRRVFFDLIGLPPSPQELEAFVADPSEAAYQRVIDQLLQRPEYGQRWGRHWLDLVRYAESDGYKQDAYRPWAWRYRDYVIRSFNEDKPYDRFLQEQLAGDELFPQDVEAVVATGFLRHGIYEYNQRDVRTQWDGIINEVVDVTADVFLGVGLQCARCHDHKFDPVLRDDYYRMRAFFEAMLPVDDYPVADHAARQSYASQLDRWESLTTSIRQELSELERPVRERVANAAIDKFPPDIRPLLRKPASERDPLEQQLAELSLRQVKTEYDKLDFDKSLKGDQQQSWRARQDALKKYQDRRPNDLPRAAIMTDVGQTAPKTQVPGDRRQRELSPGFLTVLGLPDPAIESNGQTTGRRAALARWMSDPSNHLTTRVIVNRVWHYHFGRGIVSTTSDFGRLGDPPTHPELLDYLADWFVRHDWSFKALHRLILTSATYRQAAFGNPAADRARMLDPQNRLLWRAPIRRLQAEQIRDAILAATGELDDSAGGPAVASTQPRRTVYTQVYRNQRDELMESFDAPDGITSAPERNTTTTPLQALLMFNSPWSLQRAQALARRVLSEADNRPARVDRLYQLLYGRRPTTEERQWINGLLTATPDRSKRPMQSWASIRALQFDDRQLHVMTVADRSNYGQSDFTLEAIVQLDSLYQDASVRTIAAQWNSNNKQPGWSLGVTSTKSRYTPRNLILQLVGNSKGGQRVYEVIPSGLKLELGKPYYVAVSVDRDDTTSRGVEFTLQALGDGQAQTAHVEHQVIGDHLATCPLTVGGRADHTRHRWHGWIAAVRLSSGRLARNQGLLQQTSPISTALSAAREPASQPRTGTVEGWWELGESPVGTDRSTRRNHLQPADDSAARDGVTLSPAWVDLCHVLLNTNEFVYVD